MGLSDIFKSDKTQTDFSIFIVSDDPSSLALMKTILNANGYAVFSAPTSQEALQLLNETGLPNGFIGDFTRSQMDAKEFLGHARIRYGRTVLPPVLLLMDSPEAERTAKTLEVYDLLLKPFNPEQLLQCVKGLVASRRTSEKM